MRKYLLLQAYSFAYNGKNQRELFIRSLFFLTIVFIFSKLWHVTCAHDKLFHKEAMIWYLAITETIVLSLPIIQFEIENDIRTGDVVYQLTKPVDYLLAKICENMGAFCFRFVFLVIFGLGLCLFLSDGYIPPSPSIIFAYCAAFLAGCAMIIFHACIGITAFKLQDSSPIFWIWQRSTFLFGGLLLPLEFYPKYLKWVSELLPFSGLIYSPAHLVFNSEFADFALVTVKIVLWGLFAFLSAKLLFNRGIRQLKVNGG